ncbi:hypothetical protein BDN70DRAFT_873417 [Pholiota conissans]|uniref:Uncharacterized protein n=1 Tax=Pholiota conissans TaxID=109636 RepID=A0A9P5Z8W5_9AGAR|nr:hypothetical protein BDN70DRAFT_873417 [Pholiota conissans]
MSGATPTLIPSEYIFPRLLPQAPQPHPMPLSRRRVYNSINTVRDFQREMDELSDEENEVEDLNNHIHNRGFGFLVPIGRSLTRQEEKNDAEDDSDETGSDDQSNGIGHAPSVMEEDGDHNSAPDLDASMEDLDEDVTIDSDNDEPTEAETDEFEEASDLL